VDIVGHGLLPGRQPTRCHIGLAGATVRDICMTYSDITKEITMTQDHASATQKPGLDDLLTTMGITREQLKGMTAEDLFAAATRWQDAAAIAAAEAKRSASPIDRLLDSLPGQPADLARLN
jgi:hypothetical protein